MGAVWRLGLGARHQPGYRLGGFTLVFKGETGMKNPAGRLPSGLWGAMLLLVAGRNVDVPTAGAPAVITPNGLPLMAEQPTN